MFGGSKIVKCPSKAMRGKEKYIQYLLWKQDSKHKPCSHAGLIHELSGIVVAHNTVQYSFGTKTIFPIDAKLESFMSIMMNIEHCG